jgi:DNA end-binding protein Ku
MSTMRFADEIVARKEIGELPSRRAKPDPKALKLATQIVDSLAADWKPDQYHDTYAEELRRLIKAKGDGKDVVVEEPAKPDTGNVVDLMAALEASVEAAKGKRSSGKKRPAKRKAG